MINGKEAEEINFNILSRHYHLHMRKIRGISRELLCDPRFDSGISRIYNSFDKVIVQEDDSLAMKVSRNV
jgi:hypothetical protein